MSFPQKSSPWNSLRMLIYTSKKIVKSELWKSTLRKKSLNRRQWISFWFFTGKGPSPTLQQQVLPATSIDSASPPPEPEDITPPPGPWGEKVLIENAAVHVDMGKVVGVLRATHKLEDEVNHQENGKNYFYFDTKSIKNWKFPALICITKHQCIAGVNIDIEEAFKKPFVLFKCKVHIHILKSWFVV